MKLDERLGKLEEAHRALAAQHTALQLTVRALLPLVPLPCPAASAALLAARETTRALMAEHGQDAEYQGEVMRWLDAFARAATPGMTK